MLSTVEQLGGGKYTMRLGEGVFRVLRDIFHVSFICVICLMCSCTSRDFPASINSAPIRDAGSVRTVQSLNTEAKRFSRYEKKGTERCGGDIDGFCATFDSDSTLPEGVDLGAMIIDQSIAYNSEGALRLDRGNSDFIRVKVPAPAFWVRAFLRTDAGFAKGHGTFFKTQKSGQEIRVGDHRCQLEINRDGGGGGDYEMTSGAYGENEAVCQENFGVRMQANTWYCVEAFFNGPESELQVFWDNKNVEQLHVTKTRIATNADKKITPYVAMSQKTWGPHQYDHVDIGYVNYHKDYPSTFWFDNIATSTTRVGCGDGYSEVAPLHPSTRYPNYAHEEGLSD